MRTFARVVLALAAMLGPAHASEQPSVDGQPIECELLNAAFEADSIQDSESKPIYLSPTTDSNNIQNSDFVTIQQHLPSLKPETFRSFLLQNESTHRFDCSKVRIAGREVVMADSAPADNSLYLISRAGIDAGGMQAFMVTAYTCEGLCGGGFINLFEKRSGRWVLVQSHPMWVS